MTSVESSLVKMTLPRLRSARVLCKQRRQARERVRPRPAVGSLVSLQQDDQADKADDHCR